MKWQVEITREIDCSKGRSREALEEDEDEGDQKDFERSGLQSSLSQLYPSYVFRRPSFALAASEIPKDAEGEVTMTISASVSKRSIIATVEKEDAQLSVGISFPASYPLVPAAVECIRKEGIGEHRWRR